MTIALQLTHDEPRLVYLALVYHLGRPGSELDPITKQPLEHGLREVKTSLGNEIAAASAIIELDDGQYRKLLSAIYGSVTELRVQHMRDGAESTVPRFTETAGTLFPDLRVDPDAALDLAESMMMLHRRIERAVARAAAVPGAEPAGSESAEGDAPPKRRRWWRRRV